jgi:hypothetical protein
MSPPMTEARQHRADQSRWLAIYQATGRKSRQ